MIKANRGFLKILSGFVLFASALSGILQAQTPHWIWHPNNSQPATNGEVRFFRSVFLVEGKVAKAVLSSAADNYAEVFLNGKPLVQLAGFENPTRTVLTNKLQPGLNVLAVRGTNDTASAGLLFELGITLENGKRQIIVSDAAWLAAAVEETDWHSPAFKINGNWVNAASLGPVGIAPWGDVLKPTQATPAENLTVVPGFKVELLHSATPEEGSWICMTVDHKGRLIISPQKDDQPLLRITLTSAGRVAKIEPIPAPVRQAMGLCYAHDSLYVNGHGPDGTGLYRLMDKNRNDTFETNEVHFLKKMPGEGEHGYHAVVPGPDGMIYVMNGNHTKLPEGIATNSPHRNYDEDFLLPRQWDAGGHAVGILAPGGQVLRTDPEGKYWELLLGGFRNSYDFDFNPAGEIFTFDSDMEWDWGLPWYRPTRIIHSVTGGEYGWRSGSGKWPDYYADSLPAAVNIGIGSPTGVKFGTKSNFPDKYRNALFALDWSYGRIFAVELKPSGASYAGEAELFLKGKPLNVSDLEFGRDGAMYFITGGRGTQSGLYRVSFVGDQARRRELAAVGKPDKAAEQARKQRQELEAFHGKTNSHAVDLAWPYLNSPDRFLRHAARIAIESQPVAEWRERALNEANPQAGLTALLALARCGGKPTQRDLLLALKKFPMSSLSEGQQLEKLRLIELSFIRQGRPDAELARLALDKLNPLYPSSSERVNRELVQLLIYLEAPDVITKTLRLVEQAPTREEQVHYLFHLRNVKSGWTPEQRQQYFGWFVAARQRGEAADTNSATGTFWTDPARVSQNHPAELVAWFNDTARKYSDGSSYVKYLANIRKDALATLTTDERTALGPLAGGNLDVAAWKLSRPRAFVQDWTLPDLESKLDQVGRGRDFNSGKAAFNDAQCLLCHRFGNEGGAIGPELTAASSKYSRRDILESMLEPSKVVSDQYQNHIVFKKDGEDVSGRITDENDERLVVLPNPLAPESRVEIKKTHIDRRVPSKVSPMPTGLLNNLTADEILDLLAYIESTGKAKADNFKK